MALEYTGIIVSDKSAAILVAPESAFVITAQCTYGCGPCFYVAGRTWVDDVDQATIFRSYEGGEIAKNQAREALGSMQHCLSEPGVIFDVKPLAGYVK